MSLKKKIILSFVLSAFLIALLAVFVYANFVAIRNEIRFLELTDTIRSKSLQLRRHEKNFFLYSPDNAGEESKEVRLAAKPLPGVQAIQRTQKGPVVVYSGYTRKLNEILTANDVYVFGYPSSVGIQQFPQIDYNSPLLRKGIVAGINDARKTIILDCLTFHGNSGGPVLQVSRTGLVTHFDVIGVISQYIPTTEKWVNATLNYGYLQLHNSGYTIAEPMDAVLELVDK